jgi:flavin-dependent dehydrogenase
MMRGAARGGPLVVAREAEPRVDGVEPAERATASTEPELFFCRDLEGYGWCVRKGAYVNVGLGRFDPRSLPAATARFLAFLEANGRIPPRVEWKWRGHAYAVNAAPRGLTADAGILLIGDAAGVADPQSGEGIRQAIESGLLAADTIVDARGQFARDRLEPYVDRLQARFAESAVPGAIARLVPGRVRTFAAGQLLRVPAFARRVVIDEWFLHRRQPALAW